MRKSGYIVIQEWMLDLDLRPSTLIAYAIIYGFSQNGKGKFTGGAEYIAERAKVCLRTAKKDLAELVSKGLVNKFNIRRNGSCTVCEYWVTPIDPSAISARVRV